MPDVHRRVRGVEPVDFGAQLADLGDQGLRLGHSASISATGRRRDVLALRGWNSGYATTGGPSP